MGLDQLELRLAGNHHLPLSKKFLPFGLLLGGGVLVIREAGLLAVITPVQSCDYRAVVTWEGRISQRLLSIHCVGVAIDYLWS